MSKEWLEDWLKDKKEQLKSATVFINENGNEAVEVSLSVLNKLFEQAERVQELEVWYHSYHKEAKLNNILKIQNKRYREQLELIRKDTFYEDHEFVSVRHLIRKRVDKALKGGNEW